MNITSVCGLGIGIIVCAFALTDGFANLQAMGTFLDTFSIIVVFGGTLASVILSFSAGNLVRLGKVIKKIFVASSNSALLELATIVDVARIARKNILAVEEALSKITNSYLREGLHLLIDRVERDMVMQIMMAELINKEQQMDFDAKMLKKVADLSPSWGMIGTLFGLVRLLGNLDGGAVAIGNAMALAIVTTLWGSLLSNVIFLPMYNKALEANSEEKALNEMIRDGILMIDSNERPELIEQDLIKYLNSDSIEKYQDLKAQKKVKKKKIVKEEDA